MAHVLEALGFFALVEVVGLAAVPLAGLAFGRLPGAGLGFAKPLGLLLVTWVVWMAGSSGRCRTAPGRWSPPSRCWRSPALLAEARRRALASRLAERERRAAGGARRRAEWVGARALPAQDPVRRRLWIGSEVVFAVAFAAMALLVAYSPEVWGTEKPMDMAFINAANASSSFPPHDPWMAGEDLNYYYLGHLAMAIVLRVVGTAPDEGYNLAVALVAALSATAVFTLAGTLWAAARPRLAGVRGGPVAAGRGRRRACASCSATWRACGRGWTPTGPPADYDWFAPSRVVPGTINEFPWFSFLLGDLHAHVLAAAVHGRGAGVRAAGRARRPARRRGVARRRGGARRRPGGGRAVSRELVVVPRRGGPPGAGGRHLAAGAGERGPARVRGHLAGARAGGQRRARAAVLAQLRPGRQGPRLGRRAALVQPSSQATRRCSSASSRALSAAFAARMLAARRCARPCGPRWRRCSPGRCSRRWTSPVRRRRRPARRRARRALLPPARRAGALLLAAGGRWRWCAC